VEKRNAEFQHISQSLFARYGAPTPYAQSADITVWLGDLNYRLQGISSTPARKMIEENRQSVSALLFFLRKMISVSYVSKFFLFLHYQKLRGRDQLLQEAEKGQVFSGYCEGTLSFKPTYKYDVGGSVYDTSYKVYIFLIQLNITCR
jgi:hypothetical protein